MGLYLRCAGNRPVAKHTEYFNRFAIWPIRGRSKMNFFASSKKGDILVFQFLSRPAARVPTAPSACCPVMHVMIRGRQLRRKTVPLLESGGHMPYFTRPGATAAAFDGLRPP